MDPVTRRAFLGTAGVAASLGATPASDTEAALPALKGSGAMESGIGADIRRLVEQTPLVDTHEHLSEEQMRLDALAASGGGTTAPDLGILFSHYADSDLRVAGMTEADHQKLTAYGVEPREKWRVLAPYYARCRNTGYLLCVRESIRALYGEDDLTEDNCEAISQRLREQVQPGFYRRILKEVSGIEYCQVNNLESSVFMETAQPDLLAQDISTVALCCAGNPRNVLKTLNQEASTLKQWHGVIDWVFATFGPRAIATKNQFAYNRRLDYAQVSAADAAPLFKRLVKDKDSLDDEEMKALQDHLFHYCIDQAVEYDLPVKLHTGYYAGHGGMPLERVRQNAGDLCPILKAHPTAKFVLMHITYPYQDELIALAKHYPNAYADMCWAWIINPAASVRFMKECLMAAPANKLFSFGGDYRPVELVPGHARIARRGIAQAITELLQEGWITESEAPDLVNRVMCGNAHETYNYDRALKNWKAV